ncbi:glycosyltransferase family 4 protein [Geminocystis herdmanii]|uniref:glycosyltransferase family 4 protein n=1 Tax=Geminocystis herdmanii TaxID=669359 RepID=UPI0003464B60|nr:glycosyltransferase family 4 protein [Geminocystis herdmanii]
MKIAYIVNNYGEISETFVRDLANEFVEKGHSVIIFCNQNINQDLFSNPHHFDDIKELQFSQLSLFNKITTRLYRVLKDEFAQKKHFNLKRKQATKRLIVSLNQHKPDVAFIDFGVVAVRSQLALEQLNIPFVVHFHAMDITKALNNTAYRKALPSLFESATALITPSEHIKRLLILEGANPEKISVVRLGINLEGLNPLSWEIRRKSHPSLSFLGRFTPKKHPLALIEAFNLVRQKIPHATLTMIGDGEEMTRVKQRLETLKLTDSVKLWGALPHKQALEIVNQHWLLAQHSVVALDGDQEGFPVGLAEGAALELPIVSTYHSGIPEQVIDGKTGFLVREFDYKTMAERMIELLNNPDLAEQMGKAGRENITKICNTEKRVKQILKILQHNN